ncbi:MAG TPA: sugar phosphate isomerase/epimerase family protein [Terriglobia bacterium]|nr:sugar phosphate isomerase/epimerase family protein [Terriglobia bacterium]
MRGSSITFDDYTVEEAFRIFADLGFKRVEPWKHHLKRCKTPELLQQFVEFAKELGIEMAGFNAVGEAYYKPFGTDHELEATLEGLRADVELALGLGIDTVLIWEGVRPPGYTDAQCESALLPRLIELFRSVVKMAETKGVSFLVEPHPFTVGMNDRLAAKLCDALDSQCFGILYDCCHFGVGQPNDYIGAITRLGRRIRHIHFSDSDLSTSELHYVLGAGRLDLEGILKAFKNFGYDGTLTHDLYGYPLPVAGTRRSVPILRRAYEYLGIES